MLLLAALSLALPAQEHPFILVSESDYPELRDRAANEPWATMKADAIDDALNLDYDASIADYQDRAELARVIAASCSLAYILDPDNAATYVARVEGQLHAALDDLQATQAALPWSTRRTWAYQVMPSGAAFVSYMCLDIMYDDLNPTLRAEMESDCDYFADNHRQNTWQASEYGIAAMRDLYHGNTSGYTAHMDDYMAYLDEETTEDGVFLPGCGYTRSRLTHEKRMQKHVVMDLAVRHGYHDFYNDPQFQELYEWAYGYNLTPYRRAWTFGDAKTSKDHSWNLGALKVPQYSADAARYVRWACGPFGVEKDDERRRLVHYVLADQAPSDNPLQPVSRVYEDGGAWFYDDDTSTHALAIAMWNVKEQPEAAHQHKDTNAFDFAGYGARLLRNSSYSGWGDGDWTWIHNRAKANNVVLINNTDHQDRDGNGIIEHLLSDSLDYACGDSGNALPNGRHYRNLVFVRPAADLQGYAVLFDRVLADDPSHKVDLALHPNTDQEPVVISAREEYRLLHTGEDWVPNTGEVTVFYGSQPASVDINTGYLGGGSADEMSGGRYLYSHHDTDSNGEAMLTTVLFPHDASHPKQPMTRLNPASATGGTRIDLSGTVSDYALSSLGGSVVNTADGSSFQGQAVLYRRNNGALDFYFLRGGRSFDDGAGSGFSADQDCSVFLKAGVGSMVCANPTTVTFSHPGITGVELDGSMLAPISHVPGAVTVAVPAGSHELQLRTDIAIYDADAAANVAVLPLASGDSVGITAEAVHPDGAAVSYSLSDDAGGRFAIDAGSGVVSAATALGYDDSGTHGITVLATDAGNVSSSAQFDLELQLDTELNLQGRAKSHEEIMLHWEDDALAQWYLLQRKQDGIDNQLMLLFQENTNPGDGVMERYRDRGLAPATSYTYRTSSIRE